MAVSREAASLRGPSGARLPRLGSRALARRAAAGDARAFEKIFERHHQELYRYCLAILRNRADAEDALQATMSKALQSLPGESRRIELRPWLFRVAHNEAVSIIRARRPEAETGAVELTEPAAEEAAERRERLRTLVRDLQELPERQRSALVMRELSDLSYREIGAALGCSEGSARQTVYEARQALQVREEGRSMECAEARRALSDGDRRRLRNRRLRAHLSACDGCRDFEATIGVRRADLRALTPPLPFAAAAGLLGGIAGSGAGAAGGIGAVGAGAGTVAGGIAGGAAVKGASAVAAVVLAAGVADATGTVDLPTPLTDRSEQAGGPPPTDSHQADEKPDEGGAWGEGSAAATRAQSGDKPSGDGHGQAGKSGKGGGQRHSGNDLGRAKRDQERRKGAGAPGRNGAAPGQSGSTPGQSGTTPGQSGTAPGQSGTNPSGGAPAPGQSGTSPGQSSSTPGQSALPPGQSTASPDKGAVPGRINKP